MADYEFTLPDFLENVDTDTLHQKMLDMLPEDIDKTEGGFPWDFTRPTALIASELLEFYIPEILKLMFPQWSSGEYLDYLGEMAQLTRKSSTYATATLTIAGTAGTIIKAGAVFCTEATSDAASIEYEALETYVIDDSGVVEVKVQAVEAGTGSNVNAGTIVLMSSPISGITSVTNEEAATGGVEEESDDDFRERIMEANASRNASYIGNNADYKRWAESVDGIGTAIVVPEWDGPETVKIVCIDSNGVAASDALCEAVYNYIMQPDSPYERLAPPNVILTVSQPELVSITYSFTPELEDGYTLDTVIASFAESLTDYYETASEEGEVKYVMVHALLANTAGIDDFTDFLMNGGTENITIKSDQYPYTESIDGGDG
ncbi:MAG: baseplate J/gp47 family protein [Lachnospiraceae bacterium]|nr:baseplate J/gp47 family protein [Lachnospiraceae bacterium]